MDTYDENRIFFIANILFFSDKKKLKKVSETRFYKKKNKKIKKNPQSPKGMLHQLGQLTLSHFN